MICQGKNDKLVDSELKADMKGETDGPGGSMGLADTNPLQHRVHVCNDSSYGVLRVDGYRFVV